MKFTKSQRIILAATTGVLMSLPWLQIGLGYVLLFAFVPLLFLEDFIYENREKYSTLKMFNLSYISMFFWNALSLWWIAYATLGGTIGTILINPIFYSIVMFLFHVVKRNVGKKIGYLSLIFFWIAFEHIHFIWEMSWPWITLGNAFGGNIQLVQWYEFTGSLGGTLWILISNIAIFTLLKKIINRKKYTKQIWQTAIIFLVPIIISLSIYYTYEEKSNPRNIVVVQPNIDPYNDKFGGMSAKDQLFKILDLAKSKTDNKTDFIVAPETALVRPIWEEKIKEYPEYEEIKTFLSQYKKAKMVIGLSSMKAYQEGEEISPTARKFSDTEKYYESYNTALNIDSSGNLEFYHKSKLVIGVEKIPFPLILNSIALDLGGTVGSLGTQKERTVFNSKNDSVKIAPVICYESVYGKFLSDFVKNGANLIFIITNDGWWEDTPGYKHHLSYASLRAIETRRSIARSANTGISCFINQRGEILQKTDWWKADVISGTINANNKITFYTIYGDFIGKICLYFSILILLLALVVIFKKK
jgi:apolipoprotein N-acyltransferase